jgi:spore coat protein U-like protein
MSIIRSEASGRGKFRKRSALLSIAVLAALSLGVSAAPASAATAGSTMGVSATVQATCLNTVTNLGFGTYTGVVSAATATITVTCTNTTPYNIGLDAGVATGASVTARAMTGTNAATLNYTLTSDAGNSVNWGNTPGTDTVAGTGNGSAQPITIYGNLAAGQFVAPGAYADTITATVTY